MVDLIIRPAGETLTCKPKFALQLRRHDCCGPTDYETLCHIGQEQADAIAQSVGGKVWLFGRPTNFKEPKT